jgi:signal transduction histidine kinase
LEEAQRREALRGELYQRVVAAQEAERGRIARELHDETGQALTALGMGLRSAAMSLHHDVEKTALRLRQLEGLAAQSLTELQRLVADLRPSHLDDLGLSPAIRWYAGEVGTRSGLQVEVMIEGVDRSLPQPLYTALFRVCQEALTNVVKHARASQARVLLRYGEAGLYLRIEDDGQGFDVDAHDRDASSGWGLRGIQERVALFGGNLSLHSHPGMGTVLEVEVPYLGDSGEESESQATSEV